MDKNVFYGYLIRADLKGALGYLKQFPEQAELYNKYLSIFEHEQYIEYDIDEYLNGILKLYQKYYRDVFYLRTGREAAEKNLKENLIKFFGITAEAELCAIEQKQVAEEFESRGFHFLGGRTSGYYGPYIWRSTEVKTYKVELPDGVQNYNIKLLDGFVHKSWTDFISFGAISTGGWTDGDGIINYVKASYNLDSENFRVSLLKHEAQHVRDLTDNNDISLIDLEYRAKLVELIYSKERNLLPQFCREADGKDKSNGHAAASKKIVKNFCKISGKKRIDLRILPTEQIQTIAKRLFNESRLSCK